MDPRRTQTTAYADAVVQVTPGTDLLLLNAMVHVMVEDGLIHPSFFAEHCKFVRVDGREVELADYRTFLRRYRSETVAAELGIAAAQTREIAYLFAQSEATLSLWTMGVNQRTQGVFLNNALHGLHLLAGRICRPGTTPLSLTGQGNACGGVRDTGSLAHLLPAGRMVADPAHRSEVERLWHLKPGTISPTVGYDAVELFTAVGDGRVRALLIMGTNPLQTIPDLNRVGKAADSFVAVVEPFADARTLEIADVVLPAALWIEKQGVYGQTERRYQLLEQLVQPPGEARSDFEILVDLAQRLKLDRIITAHTPEEVWEEWTGVGAVTYGNDNGQDRGAF